MLYAALSQELGPHDGTDGLQLVPATANHSDPLRGFQRVHRDRTWFLKPRTGTTALNFALRWGHKSRMRTRLPQAGGDQSVAAASASAPAQPL
jgi:hypothetical protein